MTRLESYLNDKRPFWESVFDAIQDGIVILDQGGRVFEVNPEFARMLGYSLAETRKLHVWDWEQVDVYVSKHSGADFSHSVCPECMKKHYPFIDDDLI